MRLQWVVGSDERLWEMGDIVDVLEAREAAIELRGETRRGTEILVLAIVAWGFFLIADQLMRLIVIATVDFLGLP